MKLHCQRWLFEIGNSVVKVDNAFSLLGWAQERLIVNDEIAGQAGQWFAMRRNFAEPWLSMLGDSELKVSMFARVGSVECVVELDGERLEPALLQEATWSGRRGLWPDEQAWRETVNFVWDRWGS